MSFFPLTNPFKTLPIAGKTLAEWVALNAITQEQLNSLQHPWELLDLHEEILEKQWNSRATPEIPHLAQLAEGARLLIGEGTKVLPGVYVEGLVIIGKNCKIGPNCYLRGPISIGDDCHIGQAVELKNTIVGNGSNAGHLSYIGDSILANSVNLGAGTITSNLRHDGKNHLSAVDGEIIDTGRRKFGTIIGDGVHTGIHTSLYPGRKLGPGAMTLPGEVVSKDKR
jgi:bifunctional UDP-N-acetylglucosamine pyrophosphorylase/glucosamine-1-phosphate N-acetyltransferase